MLNCDDDIDLNNPEGTHVIIIETMNKGYDISNIKPGVEGLLPVPSQMGTNSSYGKHFAPAKCARGSHILITVDLSNLY